MIYYQKISHLIFRLKYVFFFITLILFSVSCRKDKINTEPSFIFADKAIGARAISQDRAEDFFKKVKVGDIALQMGITIISNHRDSLLVAYRQHLQASVLDFSKKEKIQITRLMQEAKRLCDALNPRIYPDSILLIKTNGNHYGKTAFYTRENSIIIPSQMLAELSDKTLLSILIHEIFHLHSRIEKQKIREDLYALIQFKPRIANSPKEQLSMDDSLSKILLLNPDGIDHEWYIYCPTPDGEKWLLPLLVDNQMDTAAYFSRATLRFYEVGDGLRVDANRFYTTQDLPQLYTLIGDNTDYIIHPDEILAENFVLAVMGVPTQQILSQKGQQILDSLIDFYENF